MRFSCTVIIECGEVTCNENGKSCIFLAIRRTGSDAVCTFSPVGGGLTPLRTRDGWVVRSTECREAFKKTLKLEEAPSGQTLNPTEF